MTAPSRTTPARAARAAIAAVMTLMVALAPPAPTAATEVAPQVVLIDQSSVVVYWLHDCSTTAHRFRITNSGILLADSWEVFIADNGGSELARVADGTERPTDIDFELDPDVHGADAQVGLTVHSTHPVSGAPIAHTEYLKPGTEDCSVRETRTAIEPDVVTIAPARLLETRSFPGGSTVDGQSNGVGRVGAGGHVEVQIAGRSGIPESARGAIFNLTAIHAADPGFLTAYRCDETPPNASSVNYLGRDVVANLVFAELDADGKVCIYSHAEVDLVVDISGYTTGTGMSPVRHARLLETRRGDGFHTADGKYEGIGRLAARTWTRVQVAARGILPFGAEAALLNIAAIAPEAPGFLAVVPCGALLPTGTPTTSTVNYQPGEVVSNATAIEISDFTTPYACIYTVADTDVVLDVTGYAPAHSAFQPTPPKRVFESRQDQPITTFDGLFDSTGALFPPEWNFGTPSFEVVGREQLPVSASAALLNVTVISPEEAGFVVAFPCGNDQPNASSVNYQFMDVVPNAVLAKVGTDGRVCVGTSAITHMAVDLLGYVSPAGQPLKLRLHTCSDPNGTSLNALVFRMYGPTTSDDPALSKDLDVRASGGQPPYELAGMTPVGIDVRYDNGRLTTTLDRDVFGNWDFELVLSDAAGQELPIFMDVTRSFGGAPPGEHCAPLTGT